MSNAIRKMYDEFGVESYYSQNSETYENPHSIFALDCILNQWDKEFNSVLDLACGDGLVSKFLHSKQLAKSIIGCDKFLFERYKKETNFPCIESSFEDISNFKTILPNVDIVVISYAIDLVPKTYLNKLLYALSCYSKFLLIVRPNNHSINSEFWTEINYYKSEKSKSFLYKSKIWLLKFLIHVIILQI